MLIEQIASEINSEHTPAMILKARSKLYDLLTHCIPATTILKTLTWKLLPKIDPILRPEVVKWAAFYEHRVRQGSVSMKLSQQKHRPWLTSFQKVIFHLEAFVAKFMRVVERYVEAATELAHFLTDDFSQAT